MGEPPRYAHGVRLRLAYDGTDFHGWQAQPGLRTVQGALEQALDALGIAHSRARGASRTDSGVHAEGQVVGLSVDRELPDRGWLQALNAKLPDDVAVREAVTCDRRYDPRFDSVGKTYRYLVYAGFARNPLLRRRAWYLRPGHARRDLPVQGEGVSDWLDVEAMREAARRLVGEHDFRAFRKSTDPREDTVRTLTEVRIRPGFGDTPELLAVEVSGNAFLYNMVRILAGTLVDVGRHHTTPEAIDAMLGPDADRTLLGPTAPAHGLTLVEVRLGNGDWPPFRASKKKQRDAEVARARGAS